MTDLSLKDRVPGEIITVEIKATFLLLELTPGIRTTSPLEVRCWIDFLLGVRSECEYLSRFVAFLLCSVISLKNSI